MVALFKLCRMISYTIRIRLASQSLVFAWGKALSGARHENIRADVSNIPLSVGCLKKKKKSFILKARFWKIKLTAVHTCSSHHCKRKSGAKKGHTKSVKMLTLPGTLPMTGTNQGHLWSSSIKSQGCSDASPE